VAVIPQQKIDDAMRGVGRLHIALNRLPGLGPLIARGFSRAMAVFPMLGGMRPTDSITATREQLAAAGQDMGFPFEFSEPDGDEFILELPYCPYGFVDASQEKACDTAMDMDRFMLKLCGAELTVQETILQGAPKCRMRVRQRRGVAPER